MRIVVTTGGTGGHIFPALETARVLRDRGHEVVFIGSLGLGEGKVKEAGFQTIVVGAQGFTDRSLKGMFRFVSVMAFAIGQSLTALKQTGPQKVIGFGGYGSFAVVLSARILNIPVMIHEQNVVPGKANRLLSNMVKKVALSFPETKAYVNPAKTVWTGCPCHQKKPAEDKEQILKKFSLDPRRKTILVLGGSQGSRKINEIFFEAMTALAKDSSIQAIHMTGQKEYALYAEKYKNSSLPVKVFEFISPIEEAYMAADAAVARAGAATVCELGFFAVPSILIPYPLADGHQKYNAQILTRSGLARMIEQTDLTAESLKAALNNLLSSDFDRSTGQRKIAQSFKESPALELATAIEHL